MTLGFGDAIKRTTVQRDYDVKKPCWSLRLINFVLKHASTTGHRTRRSWLPTQSSWKCLLWMRASLPGAGQFRILRVKSWGLTQSQYSLRLLADSVNDSIYTLKAIVKNAWTESCVFPCALGLIDMVWAQSGPRRLSWLSVG